MSANLDSPLQPATAGDHHNLPDPFPVLLKDLENQDRVIQQNAIKEIFSEILKRIKADYMSLTEFELMDLVLITKLGKSLAIIGKPYFQVIDHMLDIQAWGENWVAFTNAALPLYEKEYLNLLHTAKIIYAFLSGNKNFPEIDEQESVKLVPQSNTERLTEISSITTSTYQIFTKSYFEFYLKLKKAVASLSSNASSQ
jgi:hypothetical protein